MKVLPLFIFLVEWPFLCGAVFGKNFEWRLVLPPQAQREKDSMAEAMQRAFAQEKDELREALGAEKRQALEESRAAMLEEEKVRVETMMKEDEERKGAEMQRRIQELESDHEKRTREKEEEMLAQHSARLESLEAEWAAKLACQQQELRKELEDELERTKADLQAGRQPPSVSEQGTQSEGGEVVLLEHHQELLAKAEAEAREQVTQQYEKVWLWQAESPGHCWVVNLLWLMRVVLVKLFCTSFKKASS